MANNVTPPLTGIKFKTFDTGPNGQMAGHVIYDEAQAQILGATTDAKSTATDTTSVSSMSVWKQISFSAQAMASALAGALSVVAVNAGTFAVQVTSTVSTAVTNAGTFAVQVTTFSHGKTIKTVSGSLNSDTDLVAAVTSKRIKVIAYSFITTGVNANPAIFKSNGVGGTEVARLILQAPAASSVYGANLAIAAPSFLFATLAGEKLTLDVSNADTVHYYLTYFDDDAT